PGQAHAWLEAFVIVLHQSAVEPASTGLHQSAIGICAIIKSRNEVRKAIIGRVGLAVSGPPQPQGERQPCLYLPGVIAVKLQVMPAGQHFLLVVRLGVTTEWQVFEQDVGNRVARAAVRPTNLVEQEITYGPLILDVMAEESADLEIVGTYHFR